MSSIEQTIGPNPFQVPPEQLNTQNSNTLGGNENPFLASATNAQVGFNPFTAPVQA